MEGDPNYRLVTAGTEIDPGLLFSLAPAPHRWPHLMIIGGSPGQLTGLSWLLGLLSELGIAQDLFVPEATQLAVPWLKAQALPEPGKLASNGLQQSLIDSQAVVAGIGLHISSAAQIGLEKLILGLDQPTIVTDEIIPLYKTNPQLLELKYLMPLLSMPQLIKLLGISHTGVKLAPDRGIYNVGNLLASLPTGAPLVMTYDSQRLYSYARRSQSVLHTPIPDGMSVDQLRASLVAIFAVTVWADRGAHEMTDLLELVHYIFAHMMNGHGPEETGKAIRAVLEPTL